MKNAFPLACFLVSLILLGFTYGVATMQWKLFPYGVLRDAGLAYDAWRAVISEDELPNGFAGFESAASGEPVAMIKDGAVGNELLLITGGPYQLMSRCPRFGCLAWVIDRRGQIVHVWEADLDRLWADMSGVSGLANDRSIIPTGLHLFDNGDLAIAFQGRGTFPFGIGLARLDKDGDVLWHHIDYSHHWIDADSEGRIYTPAIRLLDNDHAIGATALAIRCGKPQLYEDIVRVVAPDGETEREYSMLDALVDADQTGLLFAKRNSCDPTHLNSVDVIPAAIASKFADVDAGDLLVSLHAFSTVAILDKTSGAAKRTLTGSMIGQHSPHFLPDGDLLIFDNFGGRRELGGSRILRLNVTTGEETDVFPRDDTPADLLPVFSDFAGHLDIAGDGRRVLMSITEQGRILEVDVTTGRILWAYENVHDIAPFLDDTGYSSTTSTARFLTLGAYYVNNPQFIDRSL